MRIVIQRVHSSECTVYETGHEYSPDHITFRSAIGAGLMILVGVEDSDTIDDARWLVQKASMMRIFDDEDGVMNRSLLDIGGECMCIRIYNNLLIDQIIVFIFGWFYSCQ